MAYKQDIAMRRGEDVLLTVNMLPAQSISGWTLQLKVKKDFHQTTALVTKSGTITDATNGTFTVAIAKADTLSLEARNYVYDIRRTNSGAETILTTGTLELLPDT